MKDVTKELDKIAQELETAGLVDQALQLDKVSDRLEKDASMDKVSAEELIASDVEFIKTAVEECEAADRDIMAAESVILASKKKKKKWVQGIKLKKGRLTEYKKPGESMEDAAHRSLKSSDPSVRGMGSFFLATRGFKHKKDKK
jgi:hypothetical protein